MKKLFGYLAHQSKQLYFATRDLVASKLGISALVFTLLYALVAQFVPPVYLVELGNGLVLAFALVNLYFYLPDAIWAARNDRGEAGQYFTVGLALALLYIVEFRAFATIWRWAGYPEGWSLHPAHSFFLFVAAFGLSMLMTAPGMQKGKIPLKNWRAIIVGLSLAIFFAGITVGLFLQGRPSVLPIGSTYGYVLTDCPPDFPVKGNMSSNGRIYHVPGGHHYAQTVPEICFTDTLHAEGYGFRPVRPQATIEPLPTNNP